MIDLTPIKNWIEDENKHYTSEAIQSIDKTSFDIWFNNQIQLFCNCTKLNSEGRRINQTNDKRYNNEITTTVYMIEKYGGDNKDYYYTRLLNQHNANIEFEAINGFEYSVNTKLDKKSSIKTKNKTKQKSITFSNDSIDKTKKETAAERKLKAHIAKINSFKINIKPANDDNNTL